MVTSPLRTENELGLRFLYKLNCSITYTKFIRTLEEGENNYENEKATRRTKKIEEDHKVQHAT